MKQSKESVRRLFALVALLILFSGSAIVAPTHCRAQQAYSARKLLERTPARYPALARNMGLQGIVKLDVLVGPDGVVKETQIKGGHPVLAQSAVNSVRRWKWEPASHESHEMVEVRFTPE